MATFIDDVLAGRTSLASVDDYVGRWHDGDVDGELADYLGLTADEYDAWIADSGALGEVVAARRSRDVRRLASA